MAFDVNAARAQRLEAKGGDTWPFTLDGETYTIPTEPDRTVLVALSEASTLDETLKALLGEEQYTRLEGHHLSADDIKAIMEAYGADTALPLGEDSRSAS